MILQCHMKDPPNCVRQAPPSAVDACTSAKQTRRYMGSLSSMDAARRQAKRKMNCYWWFVSVAGAHVENTVPALQNLIRRDNARPADNFSYIEFDIHVSPCKVHIWLESRMRLSLPPCHVMRPCHALETAAQLQKIAQRIGKYATLI